MLWTVFKFYDRFFFGIHWGSILDFLFLSTELVNFISEIPTHFFYGVTLSLESILHLCHKMIRAVFTFFFFFCFPTQIYKYRIKCFIYFFGCTCGMRRFPGQSQRSNSSHSSENTKSLTDGPPRNSTPLKLSVLWNWVGYLIKGVF